MVAFISQRRHLLAAVALVLVTAAAASCGGSSKAHPTPTPTASPRPTATETPQPTPVPPGISAISFIDPLQGWAIAKCLETVTTATCNVLATGDGGLTWTVRYRSDQILKAIQFLDPEHGFFITKNQGIYATTDGGATWKGSPSSTPSGLGDVRFASPNVGYALAAKVVFRSTDAGATWLYAFGTSDCSFDTISFPTETVGWAGGSGPSGACIYHTSDGGRTWRLLFEGAADPSVAGAFRAATKYFDQARTPVSLDASNAYFDKSCKVNRLDFSEQSRGWMTVACNGALGLDFFTARTVDNAQSWQFIWGSGDCLMGCLSMTGGQFPLFFLDALHAWRQALGHAVARTEDGGTTWVEGARFENEYCCDSYSNNIFFVDAEHGWITFGDSLAITIDGGRTWSRLPVTIAP